ncbi:hypothetical protein [Microtetraspora malaysiensis]|uniref:hypothetical protein n=1 Tax=Microtetraspora malaysiensis TaxID=161358 RepID=UPI003D8DA79B
MSSTAELLPGYYIEPATGAWCTLPWPGDPNLPYNHPDRLRLLPPSLGPGLVRWARENLVHHLTGKPWTFTPGQARFFHLWYAVDIETGRFLYRSAVKRGAKGVGKDPMFGAWSLLELMGPVRIADIDGQRVIGEPHRLALVQIAANSEAQAADVLRVANAMIPAETRAEYGVDPGILRTQLDSGSRLELLTSSEMSSEGDPATAIGLNESHHMKASNGGHRVSDVARRNVGKSPRELQARLIEFTNGHEEGENSTAELSYKAWQAQVSGKAVRRDILYDSIEAPAGVNIYDERERRRGLAAAYSDAPWADLDRLEDEVLDPRTGVGQALRFYFNVIAANEEAWVEPRKFAAMAHPDVVVAEREQIAMFLDCSKSEDSTALVACRISDGHVITLGVWQRPRGDRGKGWLAPREEVDAEVRSAFDRYQVCWYGVDPSPAKDDDTEALYWRPLIDQWHRDFRRKLLLWATPGAQTGHSVLFDMRTSQPGGKERNRLFVEQAELTQAEIDEDQAFTHDGDSALVAHVNNARRKPTLWGVALGKANPHSSAKVDAAVTMVGARLGRRLVLNSGKLRKKSRSGKVVVLS